MPLTPQEPQRDYASPIATEVDRVTMLGLTAYKTDGRLVQVLTIQNSCIDSNHDMSSENSPSPPFPPVRRVVTGHTVEGKSVVVEDAPVLPHPYGARRRVYFTDLFWTEEFPSENSEGSGEGARDGPLQSKWEQFPALRVPAGWYAFCEFLS